MKSFLNSKTSLGIPFALGFVAFLVVCGAGILNVQNIAWLSHQDPAQHYLGWAFFRNSPWSWPPGLNPSYGLEVSSSIVFSDSIPLLAFLFKPFILPSPFQYFGLWTMICFLLQAVFAWFIVSLYTRHIFLRSLFCILLILFPPMLWRVGEHAALAGHFLVLSAIYLNLSPPNKGRSLCWLMLILVSSLVHFYLLSMVLCLWLAYMIDCQVRCVHDRAFVTKSLLVQFLSVVILLPLTLWLAGYFAIGNSETLSQSAATGLYGVGKMNLLAPINSQGWSDWLPSLTTSPPGASTQDVILSNQEGFNYLGLGNLLLCFFAILTLLFRKTTLPFVSHHRFLMICVILMVMFAISNNIGLGPYRLQIPLPENVKAIASIYRASGRFAWPALYLLLLLSTLAIMQSYSPKVAGAILLLCATVQIADIRPGLLGIHNKLSVTHSENINALSSPLWQTIGKEYAQVREFPLHVGAGQAHWEKLGFYAATHKMTTNATYAARFNVQNIISENARTAADISIGRYKNDAIYIIGDSAVLPVSQSLQTGDIFVRLNELNVLLPQGVNKLEPRLLKDVEWINPREVSAPLIGQTITFAKNQMGVAFLNDIDGAKTIGYGWAYPEQWGVWSEGKKASMTLLMPQSDADKAPATLELAMRAFGSSQTIQILLNDRAMKNLTLPGNVISHVELPLSAADQQARFIRVEFRIDQPRSPQSLGLADDIRQLGVGMMSARFR